jgi:hypothetical protein
MEDENILNTNFHAVRTEEYYMRSCLHTGLPFERVRKIAESDYYLHHVCLSVRPSVRKEQLRSHRTDFHEI